jgi:PTS system sorbose-specific IIC component
MLNMIPDVITGGLAVAGGFIVVVGYAMVLNMMSVAYLMPFFYLGFVMGGYLEFSLLAFGIIGLITALVYVQLNPNFKKNEGQGNQMAAVVAGELADDELED